MVTINIHKKDLWLLSAIFVFIVGSGIVIAYGGNSPSVVGHSFGEIELADCANGQYMQQSPGGLWSCKSLSSGATTQIPSCATGQFLQKTSSGWGCITFVPGSLTVIPTCANGQVIKSTGGVWVCGTDIDTNTQRTVGIGTPDYESGWFNVVGGNPVNTYTKTHNLGTKEYMVYVLYRKSSSTFYEVANFETPFRNVGLWQGFSSGANIRYMNSNSITLTTGKYVNGVGGDEAVATSEELGGETSGQWNIYLWKV